MRIKHFCWVYPVMLMTLVACNTGEDNPRKIVGKQLTSGSSTISRQSSTDEKKTQIQNVPDSENGVKPKTLYVEFEIVSRVSTVGMPEQIMRAPSGMSAAYLFRGDTTLVRVNVPAAVLPDGRARILLTEPESGRLKIMFEDTFEEDHTTDQEAIRRVIDEMKLPHQGSGEAIYESSPPTDAISWPALITIGSQEIAVEQFSRNFNNGGFQKDVTYSIDKKKRTKEQNLTQQASELKDRIRAETSATSNVILIGHSMGGLRGRSVLQMGETLPQIKALVTLGTPHAGAPIIHTGPSVMTHLGVVLGGVTGYAIGQPLLGSLAGGVGLRSMVTGITNSPAGQDLAPKSAFLNTLNSQAKPMRSDIVVLDVVGTNSDIDHYIASMGYTKDRSETYYKRQNISAALSLAAVVAAGFGIFSFGWGFVLAGILITAALFILSLPTFWRERVMGSNEGDAIVPEQSQYLPLSAGGNRELGSLRLPNANHTGKYGETQLQPSDDYPDAWVLGKKLRELQHEVKVPSSPLLPWSN